MKAKCDRCGKIVRFPYRLRRKFVYHWRCGGRFQTWFTNHKEFVLKKREEEKIKESVNQCAKKL